jgi:hypothetical protein
MSQKIVISLEELKHAYIQAKLERLQKGYSLPYCTTKLSHKLVKFLFVFGAKLQLARQGYHKKIVYQNTGLLGSFNDVRSG